MFMSKEHLTKIYVVYDTKNINISQDYVDSFRVCSLTCFPPQLEEEEMKEVWRKVLETPIRQKSLN